jgi:ADP-ribose pyrophosphatase YjhB (NUDIX family)
MDKYYQDEDRQLVAVDCIIFGFDAGYLKLLLIKRNFEPGKGQWSLAGGFLRRNESLDECASRVLHELTGLKEVYLEQLQSYGEVNRDPGERVVSIAYYALLNIRDHNLDLQYENEACWCPLESMPGLIFDHRDMVDKALRRLKRKIKIQPVGFELLPDRFTLPQLQSLYESIYQKELDKRNFRKKILSMELLDKLTEKDKSGSKKGAYFYRFNQRKYNQLVSDGFYFNLDI